MLIFIRIPGPPKMAACIKPMFNGFNKAMSLVEFVEFYKLLGVSHFVFYNQWIGENVIKVLDYYQKKGEVTIMRYTYYVFTV